MREARFGKSVAGEARPVQVGLCRVLVEVAQSLVHAEEKMIKLLIVQLKSLSTALPLCVYN